MTGDIHVFFFGNGLIDDVIVIGWTDSDFKISRACFAGYSSLALNILSFSYEPELHPGVTYKITEPKATLKIFSTGSITVTGKSKATD